MNIRSGRSATLTPRILTSRSSSAGRGPRGGARGGSRGGAGRHLEQRSVGGQDYITYYRGCVRSGAAGVSDAAAALLVFLAPRGGAAVRPLLFAALLPVGGAVR